MGRTFRKQPRNTLNNSPLGPQLQKDVAIENSSLLPLASGLGQALHVAWMPLCYTASLSYAIKDVAIVKTVVSGIYLHFQ